MQTPAYLAAMTLQINTNQCGVEALEPKAPLSRLPESSRGVDEDHKKDTNLERPTSPDLELDEPVPNAVDEVTDCVLVTLNMSGSAETWIATRCCWYQHGVGFRHPCCLHRNFP